MRAADSSPSENSLEVTPSEVASQLTRGEIRLIDVRTPHEYQIASIAGSILLDQAKVEEVVETWPKDGAIVTICHHGIRSLDAAIFLRGKGFTNVRSMTGGIEAWSRTIDPAIPRY